MGLLTELRGQWTGPLSSSSPELAKLWASPPTSTGVSITETNALNYSAVWAAVSLISSQVASLPLILYARRKDGGKDRKPNHPLYWLLHDEPNSEMSSFVFREALQAHVLTWGNGYAEIERDMSDRPIALWPITPDRVTPTRDRADNLTYKVRNPDGKDVFLQPRNMFHLPGLGFDGNVGYSVISKARESIGLGIATERFGGTFFGNGATFGGVLKHPGKLSPNAQKLLTDQIEAKHQGLTRAHRFLLLQEAMDYVGTGVPPEAAQFLETRLFQIIEICRWFNIPPHKLRDLSRATFSNIEQQAIEFVTDTLRPWLIRWEQEIQRKLIAPLEQGIQFAEHLVDGLMRGDTTSRYAAYAVGRQWGWLSADDVLERENMNPLPNGQGKIYLVPQNMAPADRINDIIDKQTAPTPAPAPQADPPAPEDKNAGRAVEVLREQLAAALQRAEEQIALATTAEASAEQARADNAALSAIADQHHAAADAAQAEASRLTARVAELEATEQSAAAVRQELVAAQQRAEELAAIAAAADQASAELLRGQEALTAQLAGAAEAQQEVARLRALLIEATERADREQAEQERAAAAVAASRLETTEARRGAEAAADSQRQEAAARASAEQRLQELEGQLAAARAAREAAEATVATQRQVELDRLTASISAHRGLIVDAMGRMVRRETEKARRAHATPEKLRQWIDAFYLTHEDTCVEALLPAVRVHLAWSQSADDPTSVTRTIVRDHVRESVRQLRAVAGGDPEDLHVSLERMLQRWEEDRPAAVADRILAEEIEYVRSLHR